MNRIEYFLSNKTQNRFWWFKINEYLPSIYSDLSEHEFKLLIEWFEDTKRLKLMGECNIPILSAILGFVIGNGVDAIVQLGHYAGYSTLILGWALRRMGKTKSLFTIDIDPVVTKYTNYWIEKAGLQNYVSSFISDSSDPKCVDAAKSYLDRGIKMIFVDSSHQYVHTLKELDLWYKELLPSGIMFLHDVSVDAQKFDSTKKGGVKKALDEWSKAANVPVFKLLPPIYQDGCGLGLIQK